MKIILVTIGYMLCFFNAFCQVSKVYVSPSGKYVDDPRKAESYVLIQELDDSTYVVNKYNMCDTLVMKGTFKDRYMSVPNGKFVYYSKNPIIWISGVLNRDTNTFVSKVGYFSNGMKTGLWMEFEMRSIKSSSYIYKNNKLNGIYKQYSAKVPNYTLEEGNYVDGEKEGIWNVFGLDTLNAPVKTLVYSHDKLIKKTTHYEGISYPPHFSENLFNRLSSKWDTTKKSVKLHFFIDSNGKVINPQITQSHNSSVDAAVLSFLARSKIYPEKYDAISLSRHYDMEITLTGKHNDLTGLQVTVAHILV